MFESNYKYKRSDLHDQYGGSRQSGISASVKYSYIFIFTGKTGKQHGYEDVWDKDNYFWYTGEGQTGDMTFKLGNKALLNHQLNKKRVFLFEGKEKGYCEFIDELELVDYEYFQTPDTNGNQRQAIRFKFKSINEKPPVNKSEHQGSVNLNKPNITTRQGLINSRVGQGYFRKRILEKWSNKCAVTGIDIEEILIASHIVPWKNATDEERLDPENGILLSPNLDALFDKYLISFKDDGYILISNQLNDKQRHYLGIEESMRLVNVTKECLPYLKRHRQIFIEKSEGKSK